MKFSNFDWILTNSAILSHKFLKRSLIEQHIVVAFSEQSTLFFFTQTLYTQYYIIDWHKIYSMAEVLNNAIIRSIDPILMQMDNRKCQPNNNKDAFFWVQRSCRLCLKQINRLFVFYLITPVEIYCTRVMLFWSVLLKPIKTKSYNEWKKNLASIYL